VIRDNSSPESEIRSAKDAKLRYAEILTSGKTVPWSEMRRYLQRELTGNKTARPKPRALAR
jgi:hypothetical protein